MPSQSTKTIALFTSITARGSVGSRAALFALERLGHRVIFLPTIVLPFHPGHGPSTRSAIDGDVFSQQMEELAASSDLSRIDAVLSGYFADAEQVRSVSKWVDQVKSTNPNAVYLCDPICGDGDRLYLAQDIALALRDILVPKADIITPNRFELSWLSQCDGVLDDNNQLIDAARRLNIGETLITSAVPMMQNGAAALLVNDQTMVTAEHRALPVAPNGLGDLTSALYLHHYLMGESASDRLQKTISSVFEVLTFSAAARSQELLIPASQDALVYPRAPVTLRQWLKAASR